MIIFDAMNKKVITGLIALMGISIIGIIVIQLIWMNNAIRVRNELFDRSVNEALNSTTNRLETMQDFRMINHFSFGDSMQFRNRIPPPPPVPPDFIGKMPKRIIVPKRSRDASQRQIETIVKAARNKNGFRYQISTKTDSIHSGGDAIFINTDSVVMDLGSVYEHGLNKFDSLVGQFEEWTDSTNRIKQRIEVKTHKLKRIANKVVQEISTWEEDVPIDHVNEVLKKELENRNIPISFETGIIKDSLISSKTEKADSLLLAKSGYVVNMFPNDIFQKNIRLSVYFPDKDSFIYKTLNWLLFISLLFSVIVLVTFAVSIYFILKQKKISEMMLNAWWAL